MSVRKIWRLLTIAVAFVALGTAVSACGSSDSGGTAENVKTTDSGRLAEMTKATLVLDFVPNAVHAGIYRAIAAGYYRDHNIDLKVIQPTSTADTLRLINANKADFGLADGLDVANQIGEGLDIETFMAIVQRPLGGVITLKRDNITSGKDFEGKTVGVTGVPSDNATLDTVVKNDGGDPSKVKVVTIGFNGVQNLQSGKVAGFIGFWAADGVQLDVDGAPTKSFKLDENGGPVYPGLVAFSTTKHMQQDPALIRAFAAATVQGYEDTIRDPQQSLQDLLDLNKSLRKDLTSAQMDAFAPLFMGDAARFGEINADNIKALSDWMVENRLARESFTPERYGSNTYLAGAGGS